MYKMVVYNHTMPSEMFNNCDGFLYCFSDWAGGVTGGLWWPMTLLGFCLILFIGTQRFGTTRAFGFASMMGMMASLWLATAQLMAWWITTMFIVIGVIGLVALIINER